MKSFNDKIINDFLQCPNNKKLFDEYQKTKEEDCKLLLDEQFKKFYQQFRLISYLIKVLHYESKHFDKKIRQHNSRNQLILSNNMDLLENVKCSSDISDEMNYSSNIEDHITSERLLKSISNLTDRQKQIMSLAYIEQMTDTEIARHLKITQQAVSKAKSRAIKKIRES
ncbi:RNA polymerase sigma factor (sigma-70 family) [Sporosarcina luteola]|nr:RNA polymerase sigma factor (sigma-70 family) [Sporosarcina luteola]